MNILTPFPPIHICEISLTRGEEFRNYGTKISDSEDYKATDEQWRSKLLIDGSNESCNNISAIYLKVGDESMSAVCFWKK